MSSPELHRSVVWNLVGTEVRIARWGQGGRWLAFAGTSSSPEELARLTESGLTALPRPDFETRAELGRNIAEVLRLPSPLEYRFEEVLYRVGATQYGVYRDRGEAGWRIMSKPMRDGLPSDGDLDRSYPTRRSAIEALMEADPRSFAEATG